MSRRRPSTLSFAPPLAVWPPLSKRRGGATWPAAGRAAIAAAWGERSVVTAHLSHSYPHGGSIYYTFIARQEEGQEIQQWERAKTAATQVIADRGAALSHHHGIGSEH